MKRTKHFVERMAARGISEKEVELTHRFGVQKRDKVVLGTKTCAALAARVNEVLAQLKAAQARGELTRLPQFD